MHFKNISSDLSPWVVPTHIHTWKLVIQRVLRSAAGNYSDGNRLRGTREKFPFEHTAFPAMLYLRVCLF